MKKSPERGRGVNSIYLAGPMTGKPEHNFPAFLRIGEALEEAGFIVSNPAKKDLENGFDPSALPWEQGHDIAAAFLWDFQAVLEADAVFLMPGWIHSVGATVEFLVARLCGKSTYLVDEEPDGSLWYTEFSVPREDLDAFLNLS